jgi:hypothetical protein
VGCLDCAWSVQSDVPLCRFAGRHDSIVGQLLLAGANINSTNNDDISPLVWAIDQLNMAYGMQAMVRRRWRVSLLGIRRSGVGMGKERAPLKANHVVFSFHFIPFVKGTHTPSFAQRTDEGGGFL